ncbi:MAG: hypothetical protein AAFQ68_21875 [Bacteroidota bacterium]
MSLQTKITFGLFLYFFTQNALGQTIWNGPKIIFEKLDSTNWLLAENQDRISDSVWITRKNMEGFFNIRKENTFDRQGKSSPAGTEWANGRISDGLNNLTFTTWLESHVGGPNEEVGVDKVLHLIEEDIYLDLKLLSWTQGGGGSGTGFGGGFRYERSTPMINDLEEQASQEAPIILQQGPYLSIRQQATIEQLKVFSVSGEGLIETQVLPPVQRYDLSIDNLRPGMYLLLINDRTFVKFIKY